MEERKAGSIGWGLAPMMVIIVFAAYFLGGMTYIWWGVGIVGGLFVLWVLLVTGAFIWALKVLAGDKHRKAYWFVVIVGGFIFLRMLLKHRVDREELADAFRRK